MTGEVAIMPNRLKYLLVVAGSLLFVGVGIVVVLASPGKNPTDRAGAWLFSLLCISFFGMAAAFAGLRLFDPRPAILLTPEKFINRSAALQIPEVSWSEIAYAEISHSMNQRLLLIHLKDPQAVLDRQTDLVRKTCSANMAITGSPVTIAGSILSISLDDLLRLVNERISA